MSNSQSLASNVINKIHINTAKSRIHDIAPLRSPNLHPFPAKYRQSPFDN